MGHFSIIKTVYIKYVGHLGCFSKTTQDIAKIKDNPQ